MATISLVEVDTDQLSRDIQRLQSTLRQTRGHIATLHNKMDAMNGMWEGPANQTIRRRFRRDHAQMLDLCASVEGLLQTLESVRQAYNACEDNVQGVVDALRI